MRVIVIHDFAHLSRHQRIQIDFFRKALATSFDDAGDQLVLPLLLLNPVTDGFRKERIAVERHIIHVHKFQTVSIIEQEIAFLKRLAGLEVGHISSIAYVVGAKRHRKGVFFITDNLFAISGFGFEQITAVVDVRKSHLDRVFLIVAPGLVGHGCLMGRKVFFIFYNILEITDIAEYESGFVAADAAFDTLAVKLGNKAFHACATICDSLFGAGKCLAVLFESAALVPKGLEIGGGGGRFTLHQPEFVLEAPLSRHHRDRLAFVALGVAAEDGV